LRRQGGSTIRPEAGGRRTGTRFRKTGAGKVHRTRTIPQNDVGVCYAWKGATVAKYRRPLRPAWLLSMNAGDRLGAFDLAIQGELLLPRRLTLS